MKRLYLVKNVKKNIKFLTTSFGCNSQILNFWNKCKFLLIKLGAKPEVSSGEHSGICIKPLSSAALDISSAIAIEFRQELLYQLDKVFQHLDENLIRLLLLSQPNANTGLYTHVNMLKQFAMGNRTFISCKRLLREYLVAFPHCLDKLKLTGSNLMKTDKKGTMFSRMEKECKLLQQKPATGEKFSFHFPENLRI